MGDTITLFPPYGIDQTIHVAILIGVLLLLGLTETFGWVWSGLVVPGYLASLFVLEPASGAAVMIEALLTFLLARLLSTAAPRSGAWSLFFGRERFLLLIFISVAVRQASELWVMPEALRWVDEQAGTTYRLTRTFSSVGLVLVPLTANMFWKLSLRRGLIQVAVPTALTYAILAYVLLPYTNLSFARLEITYENVALDFMSSPKAYILLVIGAYIASRWNLMYGWDYAGILVPALLALAWLSPARLVTTLAETLALVVLVRALVLVPGLRTLNLEGPRKVALVFTVSFLLKWGLGWVVGPSVSDLRITDLFGFGYLLSSLLAVKILQKDAVARIAVPTAVVSVVALVLGSAVGFGLDQLAPAPPPVAVAPTAGATPPSTTTVLAQSPRGVLALGHVRARLDVASDVPLARSSYELDRYRELWQAIAAWLAAPSEAARAGVAQRAMTLGLALRPADRLGGREAWGLFELEERLAAHVGWDTAVLIPGAQGPIVAVPRPASNAPTAEAAAALCERVACRAVLVSGLDLRRVRGLDPDRAPHAVARRALGEVPALELRADPGAPRGRGVLHVANEAPEVNVSALWPRGLELSWQPPPGPDPRRGASVLRAHPEDYRDVIAEGASPPVRRGVSVEAWFGEYFARPDPRASPPAADITPQPPSQSELAFLERVVAAPALARPDPRFAHALAGIVGYAIHLLPDCAGPGAGCWILAEASRPRRLGWGALAHRTGAPPVAIELPRPRREAGTWRLGVEMWRHSGAATLIAADGDVPEERADADPAATWNVATAFQALHQAVHDELRADVDPLIVQIRGFGITQPIREPAVVSLTRPTLVASQVPRRLATLLEARGPLGALRGARVHDGARELVEVSGIGNPQLHHCARFELVSCAILWFSEPVRDAYRESDRARELAKLARMKLPITAASAPAALHDPPLAAPDPARIAAMRPRFDELVRLLETYALEQNVQLLRRLEAAAAPPKLARAAPGRRRPADDRAAAVAIQVRGGYSDELGRPFVVAELRDGDHAMRAIALVPSGAARIELVAGGDVANRLPALLAERPRIITLAGRARAPAPAQDGGAADGR